MNEPKAEKPYSGKPTSDNPLHKKKIGKKENKSFLTLKDIINQNKLDDLSLKV